MTSNKVSNESLLNWKNRFHKSPLFFRICPDFEADNEIDTSNIGSKTSNIYKKNHERNGDYKVSALNDVSKSG